MLNTITEENKIHWRVVSIVDFKAFIKLGDKLVSLTEFDILRSILEVAKENIFVILNVPAHIKIGFHELMCQIVELGPIIFIN